MRYAQFLCCAYRYFCAFDIFLHKEYTCVAFSVNRKNMIVLRKEERILTVSEILTTCNAKFRIGKDNAYDNRTRKENTHS